MQPADSVVPDALDEQADEKADEKAGQKAAHRAERQEERRETRQEARQEARHEARQDAREEAREAKATKFETYTVRAGDSLSGIGARFGVSYEEIARLNKIDDPDLIFPGQVFRIPTS
ncbi:hypothetical protein C7S10_06620 [Nocardioides currus]|uniref:LysM domain-containing protein n=1 Tax=Nocardioides currus TaxID=2133958 RepID=A0A2R7Z0I0_9ACTN|nr:hypothetical protein C7S10_06620 [Nocardioides currus]